MTNPTSRYKKSRKIAKKMNKRIKDNLEAIKKAKEGKSED